MPECEAMYLVNYLFEIGPVTGDSNVTHQELVAWQSNTGVELESWETRIMHRMSLEYIAESQRAKNPSRLAPWTDSSYIKAVSNNLQNAILGMTK